MTILLISVPAILVIAGVAAWAARDEIAARRLTGLPEAGKAVTGPRWRLMRLIRRRYRGGNVHAASAALEMTGTWTAPDGTVWRVKRWRWRSGPRGG